VQQNGLLFDAIANVSDSEWKTLHVRGTPTLVLVNQSGRITRTWLGRLGPADERDVESAVGVVIN